MNLPCLGIDIAKLKFNVCLLQLNGKLKHKVFSNTLLGFAQLHEWLAKRYRAVSCKARKGFRAAQWQVADYYIFAKF